MFAEWRVVTAHFSWIDVYLLFCSQFYSADIFGQWLKNGNSFLKEKGHGYCESNNLLTTSTLGCKYKFPLIFQD